MVWGLAGKTGVKSSAVMEGFDVIEDGRASLGACSEAMMIDEFVFGKMRRFTASRCQDAISRSQRPPS